MDSIHPSVTGRKISNNGPRVLEVDEFCSTYKVGRSKTYRLIAAGELAAKKLGTKTVIEVDEAERWLASLPAFPRKASAVAA
jgi:excisionase family DNA binding protein